MSEVDGEWACTLKTPMGAQASTLTVKSDGAGGFTGTNSGAMGSLDVVDGKVDGNTLTWKMNVTAPMPMTLEAKAVVDGDEMTGDVKLGAFGNAPMTGTRKA